MCARPESCEERDTPAKVVATLRLYREPLTSPRGGPIPDNIPRKRYPKPVWLEPAVDFARNGFTVAVFDGRRRDALYHDLHHALQARHGQLNSTSPPELPPAETSQSAGLVRSVMAYSADLGKQVLTPLFAEAWWAVCDAMESMGLEFDERVMDHLGAFASRTENFGCAWLAHRIYYQLCLRLGDDTAPTIRETLNKVMPPQANVACRGAFVEPLWRAHRLRRAPKATMVGANREGGAVVSDDSQSLRTEPFASARDLGELAAEIHKLINQCDAMCWFRDCLREWYRLWKDRSNAERDWVKGRNAHHLRVLENERLQDRDKGPPGKGYLFEEDAILLRDADGEPVAMSVAGAWMPPELSKAARDENRYPLPVPKGELSLPDRVAALAAIHDATDGGWAEINPWLDSDDERAKVVYKGLIDKVNQIPEGNLPVLRVMLDEVGRELVRQTGAGSKRDHALASDADLLGAPPPAAPDIRPATTSSAPLSEQEHAVLDIITQQDPNKGITGKEIINELRRQQPPTEIEQGTLTRHIIPRLKQHHHVKNRPGVGYYLESS